MSKKNWNQPEIQAAFTEAITAAVGDTPAKRTLRDALLNPTTATDAFARLGDINVPEGVEVIFVRQEDLPLRLVVALPALPENIGQPGMPAQAFGATFRDCFLCTYNTYESVAAEAPANLLAAVNAASATQEA